MKQKEKYTLEELYDNLEITLTELSKRSDMSHGTLTRIRNGVPARRSTVNKLLRVFSEIYRIELSVDNVEGIALEEKGKHEKPTKPIAQAVEKPVISTPTIDDSSQQEVAQKQPTIAKRRTWKQPPKKSDLPEGCIVYSDFAKQHGLPPTTFRDHIKIGLGPKGALIHGPGIPEDGSVLVKDYVRTESRPKPGREKETELYLTSDQQRAALAFWRRHDVAFTECDNPDCPCHKGE